MVSSSSKVASALAGIKPHRVHLHCTVLGKRVQLHASRRCANALTMAVSCRVDTDHEELFRQESYFAYLTAVLEPDCWATIELPSGRSTLFVPRLDDEYAVWMGELKTPTQFGAIYRFEDARYVDELQASVQSALLVAGEIPHAYSLCCCRCTSLPVARSHLPNIHHRRRCMRSRAIRQKQRQRCQHC